MSLRLPSSDSPIRERFDLSQLAELGSSSEKLRQLPTFRDAIRSGQEYLAKESAVKSVDYLTLRANGSVALVEVRRSTQKEVWNFGKVRG